MLYIRMFLSMGISLYTSRIVLDALGIEDYGIYHVVGGIVAMFSLLNSSMTSATQRFLTFEIGKNNLSQLHTVFNVSVRIHLFIAGVILVLAETIGLWFLNYQLVIPPDRLVAANWVFQFSILATLFSVLNIPYLSMIIAHERMKIFASVSILESVLKLLIVFLLLWIDQIDKLVLYALLVFIVATVIRAIYRGYCIRNFQESHFQWLNDKETVKQMTSFSVWDLYGNMSVVARGQGVNILQNVFFGPVINAAGGIAMQVQNTLAGFADNFLTAVRPQIVKSYATDDLDYMQKLIINTSKFSYLLLLLVSLPLILETEYVLNLWLKEVPPYAVVFCQLSLINNLISIMFRTLMFSIHATGKLKRISFINGTIYLMVLPISYVLFKLGYPPVVPLVVNILLLVAGCISNLITLKLYIPSFSIPNFLLKVVMTCLVITSLSLILPMFTYLNLTEGFYRFAVVSAASLLGVSIFAYTLGLDQEMRQMVLNKVRAKLKRNA